MATVTSLTREKINELLAGWQGVALSQDQINALISQLWTQQESVNVEMEALNNVTIPQLQADLAAGSIQVSDLNDNKLPDLQAALDQHQLNIDNLNAVDIPNLQTQISSNWGWIEELDTVTLPAWQAEMDANNAAITELNDVTLPALDSRLTTVEGAAGFDPTELNAAIADLQGKFPVVADDISADAVTANKIATDAVTANKIAAGAVIAGKIAADAVTANEIAADSITATELAAGAVVAGKIAADAVTANTIAADAVTATKIAAGSVVAGKIAADAVTANTIAADAVTATKIAADSVTATKIATDAVTANKIQANAITSTKIDAEAVTSAKIAAGAVTALKIQAGSITGDRIAADTIAVTKLIVSDLTNYAVDGDLADATMATWDRVGSPLLTRVDPAGEVPYLEQVTGESFIYFHNLNFFETSAGDEYYLTYEVSTPATNTANVNLNNGIELYNADGAGIFWNSSAAQTVVAPNTDWTPVQVVIPIVNTDARRGHFNLYVDPTPGSVQTVRLRKISLRKRGNGSLIIDGSIKAKQLDIESVTAAVVNTGSIQSQLSVTGILEIDGANMGWSAETGLYLGDDVVFYGDSRTNRVEGDLVTQSISIKDGLSLGGNADAHGTVMLSNGIATPTGKMALGQTWPKARGTAIGGDGTSDESGIWQSIADYDATRWVIPFNFLGAGFRLVNKSDLSFGGDLTVAAWAQEFYPYAGAAIVGSYMYILGSDGKRNGNYYIYKTDKTGGINKVAEKLITTLDGFDGKRMRLFTDGTNIGMVYNQKATGNLRLRWFRASDLVEVGSGFDLLTGQGVVNVGGAYYGPTYAGGPNRLVVSQFTGDSNMIRVWSLTGSTAVTRQASEEWVRAASATVCGLFYDTTQGRMLSYDKYGNFYTYSKYINGGTLNAQYTLYDGDNSVYPAGTIIGGVDKSGLASGFHETAPSPLTSFALSKRAWPTVTSPPATDELVTDVTQVDKANRLGIYASVGGTPRLQGGYQAVGVRSLPVTDAYDAASTLAGSSTVPSFATASVPAPGRFRSAAEQGGSAIIDLNGSGAGRAGHVRWDANSRPLNFGTWTSNSVQACASSTFTARTGWAQRDNVNSTTHGISYANGVFTVAQSGLWYMQGGLTIEGAAQTSGRRITTIRVNGADRFRQEVVAGSVATNNVTPACGGFMYLAAGSTVSVMGWQNSGGSLNFLANDEINHFSMYCLAAY